MPLSLVLTLNDLPDSLIEQFAAGDGLLWTGAGVSRRQPVRQEDGRTVWAGVPVAAALEAHLRAWTPHPHPGEAGFEELATIYAQRPGRSRLNRLLRAAYFTGARLAPSFYDRIARLSAYVRVFVTTNYDPFLERALVARRPAVVVVEQGLERVSNRQPAVYKVHGDAQYPETCVITTPDYDRWERDATQLRDTLSTLFVAHTVVALGYRAQDGNFRRLLGAVNARTRARSGEPRALYVVTPDAAIEDFAAYDVPEHEVVLIRATGEDFLDWLLTRLAECQRTADADALSLLIDAPAVRAARDNASGLRPETDPGFAHQTDPPDEAWSAYANALLTLADALQTARRPEEAIRVRADASRALRVAGANARADSVVRDAYVTALVNRRDARLADDLRLHYARAAGGEQMVRMSEDAEVAYYAALAETLTGVPGAPPVFLEYLGKNAPSTQLAEASPEAVPPRGNVIETSAPPSLTRADIASARVNSASQEVDPAPFRAARVRAEYAVTQLAFQEAASAFEEARNYACTAEERAECLVRAALFRGLSHGSSETGTRSDARARLQALAVPDAVESLRLRAEAWLAALDADFTLAVETFSVVGRRAMGLLDAVGAANAYRSAEWALLQQPELLVIQDGPGTLAYRLESSAARQPDAPRVSAHELLEEAERCLRGSKTREAWLTALAAQRLAYDDVDPGNVHRARIVLANVWEQTLKAGGDVLRDDFSIHSALYYCARVHAELDNTERARRVEVLSRALTVYANPAKRSAAIRDIGAQATSRAERASALMLLSDLAPVLNAQDIEETAIPILRDGIADGWGASTRTNCARAACALLGNIVDRLPLKSAATIRDDLAQLEVRTPWAYRDDLYLALAQVTDRSEFAADGGAALAQQLIETLETIRATAGSATRIRSTLTIALAATMLRASAAVATQIDTEIQREAAAANWDGIAVLAGRNAPLPQRLLDEYLSGITTRMRHLTQAGSRVSFGFGPSDDPRLTQRAGRDASDKMRYAAIDGVIALLGEDRQREVVRAPWVGCAVRLAWGTSERRRDVVAALLRLATGVFAPSGIEASVGDHPLSSFRVTGFDVGALQGNALSGLGAVWSYVDEEMHPDMRAALEAALDHPDPIVRTGAAHGLQSTLTAALEWETELTPYTAGWQVEGLIRALGDPLPSVQDVARKALVTLARRAQ